MARSVPNSDETLGDGTQDLSRDELFEVLGNDRRRCILHMLLSRNGPVTIDELVTEIASWENDKAADDITSEERKRVYTALQQTHLPALETKGLVEYDSVESVVEPAGTLTDINVYLQIVDTRNVPYSILYLFLSLVGAAVLAGSIVGISPVSSLSTVTWATLIVGGFGALSLGHLFSTRRRRLNPAALVSDFDTDTYSVPTRDEAGVHPSSTVRGAVAVLVGGLAAGLVMAGILHQVMFMMPLIGSIYGVPSVVGGFAAHLGHSVAFAALFAVALSLTPLRSYVQTAGEAAAIGTIYGVVLWVGVEGLLLPNLTTAVLNPWRGLLYLPLDGLAAHLLYGGTLGAMYAAISKRLS